MTDWSDQQIIDETIRQAVASGSTDPAVVLAVFEKESSFDETAIGDGGDSVGLRQLNKHGQLYGRSFAWAMDPANAIPDAIRAFAGIKSAAGATKKQNPADHATYQRELEPLIVKWRRYLKTGATSSTVAGGGKIKQVIGPLDGPGADHMDHVHVAGYGSETDPTIRWVQQRAKAHGLKQTSGVRARKFTASGNVSDHWVGSTTTWARDFAGPMSGMQAFNREMAALVGQVPSGAAGAATGGADGMTTVGFGIPGVDLPSIDLKGLLDELLDNTVLLLIIGLMLATGLAIFGVGIYTSFKGTPVGNAAGSAATIIPAGKAAKAAKKGAT